MRTSVGRRHGTVFTKKTHVFTKSRLRESEDIILYDSTYAANVIQGIKKAQAREEAVFTSHATVKNTRSAIIPLRTNSPGTLAARVKGGGEEEEHQQPALPLVLNR